MAPWLRAPTSSRLRLAVACAVVAGVVHAGRLGAERAALAPAIAPAVASSGELVPSERHRRVMRLVSEVVERQHYRQTPLDDAMSSQIFERYLEALDGNTSYLLASDIAEFEPLRYQLDDAIEKADAGPAFAHLHALPAAQPRGAALRDRAARHRAGLHARRVLPLRPQRRGWPASAAEMHELWRKRVKNDALSLLLAGKTWPEARDVLRKRYERVAQAHRAGHSDDVFETFMNAYSHVSIRTPTTCRRAIPRNTTSR